MKIVIIHYRYYEASGPERYLFNITKLLTERGNKVIPFSLNYRENKVNEYSNYFPQPVVKEFHINETKNIISFIDKCRIIVNSFWNKEVFYGLSILLKKERPDLVYVLQYGAKLSTSIFDSCVRNKIPVVLRLSDFNLLCSKNIFYRDGNICTECIDNKFRSVIHKCVHDSRSQSFVYYLTEKFNEIRKFEKKISAIIAPSEFTINIINKSKQFKNSDFYHLPTFIDFRNLVIETPNRSYDLEEGIKLCYVGRIEDDKGIDILIKAINILFLKGLKISLDIYGADDSTFALQQKGVINDFGLCNIHFKGFKKENEIKNVFNKYHYSVIPSKWFDNMPNSLIESCINGVPVIVSRTGSLKELIKDGFNGYTFEPLSSESLAFVMESLYSMNELDYNLLSRKTMIWIKEYCNKEAHYNKLMEIFDNVIHEKNHQHNSL